MDLSKLNGDDWTAFEERHRDAYHFLLHLSLHRERESLRRKKESGHYDPLSEEYGKKRLAELEALESLDKRDVLQTYKLRATDDSGETAVVKALALSPYHPVERYEIVYRGEKLLPADTLKDAIDIASGAAGVPLA